MLNFYEVLPKSLRGSQINNPGFQKHGISLPFRMLIVGNSGSMKTNFVLNLLRLMNDTFDTIHVVTRNADEPLYNYLKSKCPDDQFTISEGVETIPDLDSVDKQHQHLVIFDDLVLSRNQGPIEEYFIRARKLNTSCIYLSQSYFRTPKTIRINCNYIVVKKLSSTRDLGLMLGDYSLGGVSKEDLIVMYRYATQAPEDGLLIDITKNQFRKNFDECL